MTSKKSTKMDALLEDFRHFRQTGEKTGRIPELTPDLLQFTGMVFDLREERRQDPIGSLVADFEHEIGMVKADQVVADFTLKAFVFGAIMTFLLMENSFSTVITLLAFSALFIFRNVYLDRKLMRLTIALDTLSKEKDFSTKTNVQWTKTIRSIPHLRKWLNRFKNPSLG